ncbi:MAG TPA: hypothetical protein VL155_15445 [Terriglobales bacterium]|jgi:hypothetical protein|nr:hypothetical protein [Terriglobales bacterium]
MNEILTPQELAARWKVPVSWIYDQVRSRAADPLPCKKFGKYVRFEWGSPELEKWLKRRDK